MTEPVKVQDMDSLQVTLRSLRDMAHEAKQAGTLTKVLKMISISNDAIEEIMQPEPSNVERLSAPAQARRAAVAQHAAQNGSVDRTLST